MDKALDLRIRGREFESRYGQDFSFCNSRFSLLAARVANEINHNIHLANALF